MSALKTITVNGKTYKVAPIVPSSGVTLLAAAWVENDGVYSQVVELAGVTSHTKVDLQPTPDQDEIFRAKTLAFVTENDNGVVTVFSIGDRPLNDYTIQATMTEVEGAGKIRGNTVGVPNPQADWEQTDPKKADYIKNKPTTADAFGAAPASHLSDENNPHNVTAEQVGAATNQYVDARVITASDPNNDGNIVLQYGGVVEGGGTGGTIPGGNTGGLSAAEVQDMIDASLENFEGGNGEPGKDGVDGKDGYTPVKGVDYWTEEDKAEIKSYIDEALAGLPTVEELPSAEEVSF